MTENSFDRCADQLTTKLCLARSKRILSHVNHSFPLRKRYLGIRINGGKTSDKRLLPANSMISVRKRMTRFALWTTPRKFQFIHIFLSSESFFQLFLSKTSKSRYIKSTIISTLVLLLLNLLSQSTYKTKSNNGSYKQQNKEAGSQTIRRGPMAILIPLDYCCCECSEG